MKNKSFLFTSESVSEGHPDKIADQVSDAVLDAILKNDSKARVACETMITTGYAVVAGEISTNCYIEIPQIVRNTMIPNKKASEWFLKSANSTGKRSQMSQYNLAIM